MPSLQGRATSILLGYQSAFDTYAAGPHQPLSVYTNQLGETRGFVDDPLLGRASFNARDPVSSAPALPQVQGSVDAALCLREAGWWFKLLFGAPTTTGSAPNYTHVFKSGASALPAATIQRRYKSDDWRRIRGVKADTLAIRAEKSDGYPRMTIGLIGRDESAPANAALSGTVNAAITLLRAAASRPIVRWDNVAIGRCVSADLSFANGLTPLNDLNGSEYVGDLDPGDASLSGNLGIRYDDSYWEGVAASETPGALELEWSRPGAEASTRLVNFKMPQTLITRQGMPITGPGAITATYQWRAEQGASEAALVVTLKNDVASY